MALETPGKQQTVETREMPALCQKRTFHSILLMSVLPPKADIAEQASQHF